MKLQRATVPANEAVPSCLLARALTAGNLDAAAACFARDACLITPDATAIHGRARIRPLLAQMVIQRVEIEIETSNRVVAGDVILARERWRVRTGGADGRGHEQTLHPNLVLRRIEGAWKISIAAPWGSGQAGL